MAAAVASLSIFAGSLIASPLLNYRLATAASTEDPERVASLVALGANAKPLTRGPGLDPAIYSQSFAAQGWDPGETLVDSAYWAFSISADKDYVIHAERLDFRIYRNTASAPGQFQVRFSRDGFTNHAAHIADLQSEEFGSDGIPFSLDLKELLSEELIIQPGDSVEFRIYAWNASDTNAVAALGPQQGPSLFGRIYELIPSKTQIGWNTNESAAELTWHSRPGYNFSVESSFDLSEWSKLESYSILADSWQSKATVEIGEESEFFRVAQLGPVESSVNEVFFSIAGNTGTEEDLTLENKIIELLDLAVPGSKVRGALYTWSRSRMANAFIAAYNRGIDVELIVGSDFAAVSQLEAAMPGRVQRCLDSNNLAGSCLGSGINHNKFFLFSELSDGARDVVVQSSANFTNPQIVNHNVMLIFRNHAAMYDAFDSYWMDLNANQGQPNYNRYENLPTGDRIFFSPYFDGNGDSGAGDPVALRLEQMAEELGFQVAKAGNFFALIPPAEPIDLQSTKIHVGMAFWTNARSGIARRLAALSQAGVDVKVIMNPESAGDNVISILLDSGAEVALLSTLHSKTMLLDYHVNGQRRRVTLTGSHNYTSPALRSNDEVLLELYDPAIYQSLLSDWQSMANHPLLQPQ